MAIEITQEMQDWFVSRNVDRVRYGMNVLGVGDLIVSTKELEIELKKGFFFSEDNPPKITDDFGITKTTPYLQDNNNKVIFVSLGQYPPDGDIYLPLTVNAGSSISYPLVTAETGLDPEPSYDVRITQSDINKMFSKNFKGFVNDVEMIVGSGFKYPFTVDFKTNDNYKFTEISPPYTYDPVEDGFIVNNPIFSKNNTIATIKYSDSNGRMFGDLDKYSITVKYVAPAPIYDLVIDSQLLSDVSLKTEQSKFYIDGAMVYEGDGFNLPYTVKFIAPFNKVFTVSRGGFDPVEEEYDSFTIIDDGTAIEKSFSSNFKISNWSFTIVDIPEPEPEPEPAYDLIITQKYINDMRLKKISVFVNDVLAVANDSYNYPFTVKLVVDETHVFTKNSSGYYDPIDDEYEKFEVINEKTLSRYFRNNDYELERFIFETDIDENVVIPEKFAYNDVFILTPEQAREIATTQFTFWQQGKGEAPATPHMQGDNIISFIDLPFIIDPSLIQGKKNIKVGIIDSFISASYLNIDSYILDMGTITIPDDKQNYLSYENTTAILHLPYANPINLDIDYVIGQTITISFNINFYDGIASVNIKSSKIDGVIDTKSIKLNINIPFGKPNDNPSDNAPRNIDFGIDNGVLRPYIEVLRYNAVLENGFFTIPIPDETLLFEQKGYVKIEEINLVSSASRSEKEMILSMLNSGVIIND